MTLAELVRDGRTTIDAGLLKAIDQQGFRDDQSHLARYGFWKAGTGPQLWGHQKAAIATILAYLNADRTIPERPEQTEAALLKLPTGTGKSGVIAILARCLPKIRRVLVLTPRQALTRQLLADIRYRFWKHIGYETKEGQLFTANAAAIGADLEALYSETLLPSTVVGVNTHLETADRAILVGTHQALDMIRKTAADHDDPQAKTFQDALRRIKDTFQLVLVDEGHYEPAVSWSRGVREFNLPTVLLSATPYRNDYKSFRVRGRFLFNYPYAAAILDRVVRPLEIVPTDDFPRGNASAVGEFVKFLGKALPPRLARTDRWFKKTTLPKVMVRADELDKLIELQTAIDAEFGTKSVVIHDRAKPVPHNRSRFSSVSAALRARPDAQFWIHQYKLMEGIDDPSFVAVAIFDLMGNGRQLVQQIGRVTRVSNGDRRLNQTAWLLASPANTDRIRISWNRYAGYENYAARNTPFIVSNEVTLPDRLLAYMAEYQYINGEFRSRFELEAPLAAQDIQLPQSAVVLETETLVDDIRDGAPIVEEAILDKDRFKITPIEGLPSNMMGFSYYAWRNSPLLVDRLFSEWKLGIFLAVQQGRLIFMQDTEGLVLDVEKLGLKRANAALVEKAFPDQASPDATRLSRLSFASLEMSQNAIRTMAVRTRSFADVFTDLLDPSLIPATAFGFVNGRARFVTFVRSRIREAAERPVSIAQYEAWTRQVAREFDDGAIKRSAVFDRYAQPIAGLTDAEAAPVSILIDFAKETFIDAQDDSSVVAQVLENEDPNYDDLCADVDPKNNEFTIRIDGTDIPCSIEYRLKTGKYRIASEELNQKYPVPQTADRRQRQTIVQRLNREQAFRILVAKPGIVYSEGKFYHPRLRWITESGTKPVLDYVVAANSLSGISSEKGEKLYKAKNKWYAGSVFGLFSAVCEQKLATLGIADDDLTRAIASYPVWLCDDDSRETADFIGIDEMDKRIAFVHAKVSKEVSSSGYSVTSLQESGRQAQASLVFISRGTPSTVWNAKRWTSVVQANTIPLKGRNRIFKDGNGLTAAQLNELLVRVTANPSFDREVWIVAARTIERAALANALDKDPMPNRLRQFLMHWDALQTTCARASVRMRLFCD
jgi:hypothetical protein